MKAIKITLIFLSIISLISCRDGIQMNQPVGNYLQLDLKLPDQGDRAVNRAIHADATVLVVSLTYPGKEPIVAEFPFSSQSELSVFVDKLAPGNDVVLDVYLGLTADLPLTQSSTVMDIKYGGNSANLTLAYNTYTVQGTLYDSDGTTLLKGQTIDIDGQTKTTDASGKFSFTVSTEDWNGYSKFYLVDKNSVPMEFARKKRALIQSRSSFTLTATPEIFIDITAKAMGENKAGVSVYISEGEVYSLIGKTDSTGRFLYGPENWNDFLPVDVKISYQGVFTESKFTTRGTPGAITGVYDSDPRVIFVSSQDSSYKLFAADYETGSYESIDFASFIGSSLYNTNAFNGGRAYTDYDKGFIYVYISQSGPTLSLFRLDGFDSANPSVTGSLDLSSIYTSVFSDGIFSVQQIVPINDGAQLLFLTTLGAFEVNTADLSLGDVWRSIDSTAGTSIVFNGAYEASDGTLYALGETYNSSYQPVNGVQGIYTLNSDLSVTRLGTTLPAAFSTFAYNLYVNGGAQYTSMIGLFPWGDKVMSAYTQSAANAESGGAIFGMSNWGLTGSPVQDSSFYYLNPVGVLPDNKFYIVNETTSSNSGLAKGILRLDSNSDTSATLKELMTNPSGANPMSYYFNPSTGFNPSGTYPSAPF